MVKSRMPQFSSGKETMILVTGATGSIGRHLVPMLSTPFKAMVRDPAKAPDCEVVVGDFDDPSSVAAALQGVDVLFLNTTGAEPVAGEQPMVRRQKAAIDAAREAGVSRVVKVSVWGAHRGGKLSEGAHWEIEQHLKASGLGWSILQPSGFMQNFLGHTGALVGVEAPVSYIDCHDIAACAAVLLEGHGRDGETFVLTGPQALGQAEIAALLGVEHTDLTPAELAEHLVGQGMPGHFADDVATLWAQVAAGSLSGVTSAVKELTGCEPRTFEQFLAHNLST